MRNLIEDCEECECDCDCKTNVNVMSQGGRDDLHSARHCSRFRPALDHQGAPAEVVHVNSPASHPPAQRQGLDHFS